MLKKVFLTLLVLLFAIPVALWAMQDQPAPQVEITGLNATGLPEVFVTANVYDSIGQPLQGLEAENFQIVGELAGQATITNVQNITDDNLPYSVVLVIDVSTSMEGLPIQLAKSAAQLFVESIRENTSVAVVTFGTDTQVIQDYTTDKAELTAAIESIEAGGVTALYQGAFDAVGIAALAPTSRRAIVLLSDGAEYGGRSQVGRGAAAEEAARRGVSFYTIGLGYGIDRTYLIQLAESTNADFDESPGPETLAGIYSDLAARLQSQYVVDINADLPLDGTVYTLALEVDTPFGTARGEADLRAPIPVPLVALPIFDTPLMDATDVTPMIRADDDIADVTYQLDDGEVVTLDDAPYSFTLDPETILPGRHTLSVVVTDEDGDTGTASGSFEVGTLPPRVSVISNLNEEVANVQTVILDVSGQTPPVSATYTIDGERAQTREEVPFGYDIDPLTLTPGEHTLTVVVENEGGETTTVDVPFTVATLPPIIVVAGLADGQVVDAPVEVEVDVVASQSPVTSITMNVNGAALDNTLVPPEAAILSKAMIDPMLFEPGNARFIAQASNETGGNAEVTVDFVIAALPPITVFDNLTEGDTLDADRTVGISFISQTPVNHVAYFMDEEELAHRFAPPWDLELDVLELGPGEHTLRVAPQSTNGQQSSVSVTFTVGEGPSLTATALAPTPTPSSTPTATPDFGATATVVARVTLDFENTASARTQVAVEATTSARAAASTGTAQAGASATAEEVSAQLSAQGTADAQATMAMQAELNAAGTAAFQSTRAARSTQNAEARETRNAQATEMGAATQTAEFEATQGQSTEVAQAATQDTRATVNAQLTQTQDAEEQASQEAEQAGASETAQAARTNTAEARATRSAELTATADVAQAQTATTEANATATAEINVAQTVIAQENATNTAEANAARTSTAEANTTATREAAQTATQDVRETQAAQAELNAMGTANAQATRGARATQNAEASETAQAEQATQDAQASETAQDEQATQDAQASETAQDEQAAQDAQASETAERENQSLTRTAAAATRDTDATQNAQATIDTQLTAIATEDVQPTQLAQQPTEVPAETERPASPTPIGTLVAIELESQAADMSDQLVLTMIVVAVIAIILIVLFIILRATRPKS